MKDYQLVVKIRNNRILRRMRDAGYDNVAKFCRDHNIDYPNIAPLISMRMSGLTGKGEWRTSALDLADALGCAPGDLFNEKQATGEIVGHTVVREIDEPALVSLEAESHALLAPPLQEELEHREELDELRNAMGTLSERERLVLEQTYGLDGEPKTLVEVSESLGISPARAGQIQFRAYKKIEKHIVVARLVSKRDAFQRRRA